MQLLFCKDKTTLHASVTYPIAKFQRTHYLIIFRSWWISEEHWVFSCRAITWTNSIILFPFMPQFPNPLLYNVLTTCGGFIWFPLLKEKETNLHTLTSDFIFFPEQNSSLLFWELFHQLVSYFPLIWEGINYLQFWL